LQGGFIAHQQAAWGLQTGGVGRHDDGDVHGRWKAADSRRIGCSPRWTRSDDAAVRQTQFGPRRQVAEGTLRQAHSGTQTTISTRKGKNALTSCVPSLCTAFDPSVFLLPLSLCFCWPSLTLRLSDGPRAR
jgi:hypothetical protein